MIAKHGEKTNRTTTKTQTAASGGGGTAITITPAAPTFKAYMDARDEAMTNKCPGGMFDCDGDRRDYAKAQFQDWLDAGGKPKRLRDGKASGPRSY